MEYIIIALLFINVAALGLGFVFGFLGLKYIFNQTPQSPPKIEIKIPPITIEQKEDKQYQELLRQRTAELHKMAEMYYEKLDKEEQDNKNQPTQKINTQDLSKTVNALYEAFLLGQEEEMSDVDD